MTEIERYQKLMEDNAFNAVFVFGSNDCGIHAGGAALEAVRSYGAIPRCAEGIQGQSYAIPTMYYLMPRNERKLPIERIAASVHRFIAFAAEHDYQTFIVTRIGCGIAGFTDEEIAPLFKDAPTNVVFPPTWASLHREIIAEVK